MPQDIASICRGFLQTQYGGHRDGPRDGIVEPGRDPALDPDPGIASLSSFLKRKWILSIMDRVGFLGMFGLRFVLNTDVNMLRGPHMM